MMVWRLYKLNFSRVHFGVGSLEDSSRGLRADTLFSALIIESLKLGGDAARDRFYSSVATGTLRFSDAFPYVGNELLLPKPMVAVRSADADSEAKKLFKKIEFVPLTSFGTFVSGQCDMLAAKEILEIQSRIGTGDIADKVFVRNGKDDAEPYRVGVFSFASEGGLWVLATGAESELEMLDELLAALTLVGLGGERSSGLGQFTLATTDPPASLTNRIITSASGIESPPYSRAMLLSVALPEEGGLEEGLDEATYKLIKRSGFVASHAYADSLLRKRDIYKFASGSVFGNTFDGVVADVSQGGNHAVYSYAKALWLGLGDAK